jgi:hypothetical protein
MAIGDVFNVEMGTAAEIRQPSSGVFERVTSITKTGTTDFTYFYDGSNQVEIFNTAVKTVIPTEDSSAFRQGLNLKILIGNTVYIQKAGSTDKIVIAGVQVDA